MPRVGFASWIQRYGWVDFVVGSLLHTPGGVEGGGAVVGSLSVPVLTWDFHKTQPYQVSIRSKTHHLLHKLL